MAPKRSSTTVSAHRQLAPELRDDLANALGYAVDSEKAGESPYIEYILGQWPGKGTLDEYVRLFIKIVGYFRRKYSTIQAVKTLIASAKRISY
jgi:hypothetical protein